MPNICGKYSAARSIYFLYIYDCCVLKFFRIRKISNSLGISKIGKFRILLHNINVTLALNFTQFQSFNKVFQFNKLYISSFFIIEHPKTYNHRQKPACICSINNLIYIILN
jgi:hypothetical protein